MYSFFRIILKIFVLPFFRIEVSGNVNILNDYENILVCANHSSNWDPFFLSGIFNRQIFWLAKAELFENPLFKVLLNGLGAIPVNRQKNDLKAIKSSIRTLRDGKVLGIFIEGTRVKEEDAGNAKSGTIMISQKTASPIIPVKISSSYKIFKKTFVTIGEPVPPIEDGKDYSEQAKQLWRNIYSLDEKRINNG